MEYINDVYLHYVMWIRKSISTKRTFPTLTNINISIHTEVR